MLSGEQVTIGFKADEPVQVWTGQIVSTMHVHLDHHNCLEILALKGGVRSSLDWDRRKETAALIFSKSPLHRRVEMCLLYDGFFSFAVVRQDVIQYSIQCFQ